MFWYFNTIIFQETLTAEMYSKISFHNKNTMFIFLKKVDNKVFISKVFVAIYFPPWKITEHLTIIR